MNDGNCRNLCGPFLAPEGAQSGFSGVDRESAHNPHRVARSYYEHPNQMISSWDLSTFKKAPTLDEAPTPSRKPPSTLYSS